MLVRCGEEEMLIDVDVSDLFHCLNEDKVIKRNGVGEALKYGSALSISDSSFFLPRGIRNSGFRCVYC